jgi:general secretion pathway protein L
MADLNTNINLDYKAFLRWWRRELCFLVPDKIKRLFNDNLGFLIIGANNRDLTLTYWLDGKAEAITTIERTEAGINSYKALQELDERLAKAGVIIRINEHNALYRELSLPAAAKENLQQVVAYELDRYTPFKAEQVYFAVKPIEDAINEQGQLKVRLMLATREWLDAVFFDAKAMGLSPLLADCEAAPNPLDRLDTAYNLLPEALRPKTAKTPRLVHSALLAGVAVLALAVLVMPVWQEYLTVEALAEKIEAIEKDAKKIKALQAEIDSVMDETQKLIDAKNATPMVVDMLNTVSSIMKNDTWLAYLQFSNNHLQIQGESPAASNLIGLLEASDMFTNARFVSPVTQNNVSKLERFQITVDTKNAKPEDANDASNEAP